MKKFSRKVFVMHPLLGGKPVGQVEVYQAEEAIGLVRSLGWLPSEGVFKDLKMDVDF